MRKSSLYLSIMTAVALLSGCGGGGGTTTAVDDTTAPTFTNTTYLYNVVEGTNKVVDLTTDDSSATFTENSVDASISGSTLTFTAPLVNADTNFTVTVTAKDAANNSASKVFTFTVTDVPEIPTYAYIAPVGDKDFVDISAAQNKGLLKVSESNLMWADDDQFQDLNYTAAVKHCEDKVIDGYSDFRLATRDEIFNTINYEMDVNNTTSLLDNDFNISRLNTIDAVWALAQGANKYYINHVSGIDVYEDDPDNNITHNTRCVRGNEVSDHNFTTTADDTIMDNITGLEWKKIANPAVTANAADAKNACEGEVDWRLPTINELRTLYNYASGTLYEIIDSAQQVAVWSSTTRKQENPDKNYVLFNAQAGGNVMSGALEDAGDPHAYTCVKSHRQ